MFPVTITDMINICMLQCQMSQFSLQCDIFSKRVWKCLIWVAKCVGERTREDLTAIKSHIRMWCLDSRSTLASWRLQKPFLIWNQHWSCRSYRFESKFNHLSVIKACERPWNCNFSNSDLTSDLDNDRRFTASPQLQRTKIGILWLGIEY